MILEAQIRKPKNTQSLRSEGILPAVIYGAGIESTSISIVGKDFLKALTNEEGTATTELSLDGKTYHVLIHEVSNDPVSGRIIHVDFLAIDMNIKATVDIDIVFEGVAPITKNGQGKLIKVTHALTIEGLPVNLPREIAVDVSGMDTLDSVFIAKDIVLPTGCTLIVGEDEDIVIASIATVTDIADDEETMSTEDALASIEVSGKKPAAETEDEK
ncbi:MAG: large subunit ribosomal protein L25 [Flavobacteriaceae bacterium]|jgi:large subunit ribosomal protein L25